MNISRFVANLTEARRNAITVVTTRNNIAREHASDLLNATIDNMIEELNTIINQNKIDKYVLLRSLLEDAEP